MLIVNNVIAHLFFCRNYLLISFGEQGADIIQKNTHAYSAAMIFFIDKAQNNFLFRSVDMLSLSFFLCQLPIRYH